MDNFHFYTILWPINKEVLYYLKSSIKCEKPHFFFLSFSLKLIPLFTYLSHDAFRAFLSLSEELVLDGGHILNLTRVIFYRVNHSSLGINYFGLELNQCKSPLFGFGD